MSLAIYLALAIPMPVYGTETTQLLTDVGVAWRILTLMVGDAKIALIPVFLQVAAL
jgi:hypothetical protein